jgi:hypothetical protein
MAIDVSTVVDALGDTGLAVAAVGAGVLLLVVIRKSFWYLQFALIEREASREYNDRYGS